MPQVLSTSGFQIYQSSKYARVTQCSEYAWIIPEYTWICPGWYAWLYLGLSEYAGIYVNMSKFAWIAFVLLWFIWKWIGEKCKYLCKYRLLQKQLFTGKGMTIVQILEHSQESNRGGVLFSTLTGLSISIKQDPTTVIFVETFQNFQSRYDDCFWVYR